jgi:hypothetical protein
MVGQHTAGTGETITGFSIACYKVVAGTSNYAVSAYTVVSGNPTTQLTTKVDISFNETQNQFNSVSGLSQSLTNGVIYCIGCSGEDMTGSTFLYYDNGSAPGRFNSTNTTLQATFGVTGTDSGRHYSIYATYTAAGLSGIALTGTVTSSITEADIVTGGKTIILTLTGDVWVVAAGGLFDAQRQNIINGCTSAQSETHGWNNEVKAKIAVTDVVRTSDTVCTITLDAEAGYDITATETITVTVPGTALLLGTGAVASPTFTITAVATTGPDLLSLLGAG